MDTQNTPVHFNLWHRDFWRLCFANLFLLTSIYMLLPGIPYFMTKEGYSLAQLGVVYAAYGLGIFLLGGFCSYLVQRYRRNRVCQMSILGVAVSLVVLYYLETFWNIKVGFEMLVAMRLIQGAFLGLAEMTLASTLIIDTCESFQRTEANYITSWFARFSIAVGPLLSLLVYDVFCMKVVFPVASVLALVALVLVSRVKFPFKAPSEKVSLISSDRFFLPQGFPLFVNIVCIMVIPGFYLSLPHSLTVYAMFFCGLFLALVAEKYVFADADNRGTDIDCGSRICFLKRSGFCRRDACTCLACIGSGHHRKPIPAFLHQACQALPAWHQYELLLPGVGTGVELRNRIGFLAGEGLVSEGSWYGFGDLESCV